MMSIDFALHGNKVSFSDIGRLEAFGVREHTAEDTSEHARCLTDGENNFLWVYLDEAGEIACMTSYMRGGNPGKILGVLCKEFDTDIECLG